VTGDTKMLGQCPCLSSVSVAGCGLGKQFFGHGLILGKASAECMRISAAMLRGLSLQALHDLQGLAVGVR
jgi:hypothetical protein